MKLTDWMDVNGICVGVTLKDKDGVLDILSALQQKCGNTLRSKQLLQEIYYREEQAPFAIGAGVAVCYLKTDAVKRPLLTAVTVPAGVDLDAPDGEKSKLIFLAVAPATEVSDPTPRLTVLLMNEDLREQLMDAADENTFMALISLAEEGAYPSASGGKQETSLLLAVVDESMEYATEAIAQLQLTAGRLGILLKIERDGSALFSSEDLREANGVILIGEELESERFDGKPLLRIDISDGLYRPEYILKAIKDAPIYHKRIVFNRKKKALSDWYYRSNVPLLPLILLTGGIFLLSAEIVRIFGGSVAIWETFRWIGERSLLLLLPRVCGMLGFRYARWQGLAVGLVGGAILEAACGGVWAALLGGFVSAILMRWSEQGIAALPKQFFWLRWLSPALGVASVSVLAILLNRIASLAQDGCQRLLMLENMPLKGLLISAGIGLDPGGPWNRAALLATDSEVLAAMSAGGLALSIGLTAYCILQRKKLDEIHYANGWTAFFGGICGAVKSYIVYFAGDPFRIAPCAAAGSGAAGLVAVSLHCRTEAMGLAGAISCNRPGAFWLAVLCGAVVCCSLLYVVCSQSKNQRSVEDKKQNI